MGYCTADTVFKKTFSVFQHIFRNVTKVEIQFTTGACRIFKERILHPEFNKLNVSSFEIHLVYTTHDTTPSRLRVKQFSIGVNTSGPRIVVIWSDIGWIICKVECYQLRLSEIRSSVWIYFSDLDLASIR